MLIKVRKNSDIKSSEITSEAAYFDRRRFIGAGSMALAGSLMTFGCADASSSSAQSSGSKENVAAPGTGGNFLESKVKSAKQTSYQLDESLTPEKDVISYNNFYEFGTDKGDPVRYAQDFKIDPWSVTVSGEAEGAGTYTLEDVLKPHTMEDRVYRFRCVEAWSMVVPWVGFPLADLVKRFKPTSKAKYVAFKTLHDPEQMRGQRSALSSIPWPYREGLTIEEAMNPLTLMVVGVYGKVLPNQNGAPLRLMLPWKYGFKSIKSIVEISFLEKQPETSWSTIAAREYGFYANVNPEVDHPRWSQARERRLPTTLFNPNWQPTLKFNGYEEEVAHLYANLDLRKNY